MAAAVTADQAACIGHHVMPEMLHPGTTLQAPAMLPIMPSQQLQQILLQQQQMQLQQHMMLQAQHVQQGLPLQVPNLQIPLLQMPQQQVLQMPPAVPVSSALSALDKLNAATHKQLLQQLLQQHPEARALVMQRLAEEQCKPVDLKHFGSAAWHALHLLDDERPSRQFNNSYRVTESLSAVIVEAAALPSAK
jgi:hypothetical protein